MKARRVMAMIIACAMLAGQVVYAEETVIEEQEIVVETKEGTAETEVEEESGSEEDAVGKETGTEDAGAENPNEEIAEEQKEEENQNDEKTMSELKGENSIANEEDVHEEFKAVNALQSSEEIYPDGPAIKTYTFSQLSPQWFTYEFSIVSDREDVCKITNVTVNESGEAYYTIEGLREGNATITFESKGTPINGGMDATDNKVTENIVVHALPGDAVKFKDAVLKSELLDYTYFDENGKETRLGEKGYISLESMKALNSLELDGHMNMGIQDLSGLEYAENLRSFSLSNSPELKDISAIKNLRELWTLDLSGNQLTDISGFGLENLIGLSSLKLADNLLTSAAGLEKLTNLTELDLANNKLTDISAIGNCTRLHTVYLEENRQLSDISALFALPSLSNAALGDTGVTMDDRLKLCGMDGEIALIKGDKVEIPSVWYVFGKRDELGIGCTVQEKNGNCLNIEKEQYSLEYSCTAKESGSTSIYIEWNGQSKTIPVTVKGEPAVQEKGDDYSIDVKPLGQNDTFEAGRAILDGNANLWQTYPEVKRIASNAKKYVADFVYYNDCPTKAGVWRELWLDEKDVLWDGEEKIAEDVQEFDARYALTSTGDMIDIYNQGAQKISQVKAWHTVTEDSESTKKVTTYVLKDDGTMWKRLEAAKEQTPEAFEKVTEGVSALYTDGYLENGKYVPYKKEVGTKEPWGAGLQSVIELEDGYILYYTENGELYLHLGYDSQSGDVKIGDVGKVKSAFGNHKYDIGRGSYYYVCMLNEKDELYRYSTQITDWEGTEIQPAELKLIAENVEEVQASEYVGWLARCKDGTYYDRQENIINMETTNELVVDRVGIFEDRDIKYLSRSVYYELVRKASGDQIVRKSGIDLLDAVVAIWKCNNTNIFALRTDGTVWNITGVPQKVLDLSEADYLRGDVNEDKQVDIQDLRLVLRYVCNKTEFSARQIRIADVEKNDGKADIQDLRKILRFVCKKIDKL